MNRKLRMPKVGTECQTQTSDSVPTTTLANMLRNEASHTVGHLRSQVYSTDDSEILGIVRSYNLVLSCHMRR